MPLFEGAFAAAVTPSRTGMFQMDLGAALDVIDFLCSHKVRGIALFGATGEFPHFNVEDRLRLGHMAIKRSRVPVIVNATASTFEDAVTIAENAASNGAAGVLLQPPYYFRYTAAEIMEFFRCFLDEVGPRIPVLLYNLPAFNNAVPIEVAVELLRRGSVAGIKDSSGDWSYFEKLLESRAAREFSLIAGNDTITARARIAGCDGFISGCACAIPEVMVALDQAITAKASARTALLSARLEEFIQQVDQFPGPLGVKEAISTRGIEIGRRAVPFSTETGRKAQAFREWFPPWLKSVQAEIAAKG